jgi:hypothetical protein
MRKRHTDSWQTVPQTTQELRYSCQLDRENEDSDHYKYTRGKRRKKTLPNSYDDKRCSSWDLRKSWKEKRKKQYYGRCKLNKYQFVTECTYPYEIENYLKDNNIPHRKVYVYGEPYTWTRTTKREFIKTGVSPVYHWKRLNPDGTRQVMFWQNTGYWIDVKLDEPVVHTISRQIGTRFIYWTKDEINFNLIGRRI